MTPAKLKPLVGMVCRITNCLSAYICSPSSQPAIGCSPAACPLSRLISFSPPGPSLFTTPADFLSQGRLPYGFHTGRTGQRITLRRSYAIPREQEVLHNFRLMACHSCG